MTEQELKEKQKAMDDKTLIALAEKTIIDLAKTGGRSHRMTVPPQIDDTDMLLSELVDRFGKALKRIENLEKTSERLMQGRDYLMQLENINISTVVADILEAFGFGRNGLDF